MSAHTAHADSHHHVTPLPTYFAVYGALLVFTVLTYAVSFANLGPFAFFVAMLVATIKATMVCAYFMHMKYDERFNVLIFLSSLFFVGLFFAFTLIDEGSRGMVNPEESREFWDSAAH
jgi:cytochrome c oxidase subunit 4